MEKENKLSDPLIRPNGKGFAVSGFIISLVAIVFFAVIAYIALMQAIQALMLSMMGLPCSRGYLISLIWLVLSIIGLVLSAIGRSKLKKSGGKKRMATAGLIISIITVVLCLALMATLKILQNQAEKKIQETTAVLENIDIEKFTNEMSATVDSLQNELNNITPSDTTPR
jgi:hypothetical protein